MIQKFDFTSKSHRFLLPVILEEIEDFSLRSTFANKLVSFDSNVICLFSVSTGFKLDSVAFVSIVHTGEAINLVIEMLIEKTKKSKFKQELFEYLSNLKQIDSRVDKIIYPCSFGHIKSLTQMGLSVDKVIMVKKVTSNEVAEINYGNTA